ncbi:MAG: glycosyltransferase [Lachnospiraceae bacterium]|nr:glycosyltransferase [Lachnospiraceae bacterium]
MRIVVNDIAASKTGALSILKDFYDHILENEKEHEWIFVLGDRLLEEKDNIRVLIRDDIKASRKKRLMFDLKDGAAYFADLKPDVLFSMQNTLPRGYKGRQVLYVHQPLPYQTRKRFSFFKPEEREYAVYQHLIGRMIDASVKRADKVIVQTEWMKKAVTEKTGVPDDRVVKVTPDIFVPEGFLTGNGSNNTVIDNNVINNDVMNNNAIDNSVMNNDVIKRFFYPAGEILYKNHGLIFEAAGILISRGITDFKVDLTLKKGDLPYLDKYPEYEQIRYIGRISRDEVFKHYINDILLFPSYIETFGYPPAEAGAVGGRILASDCSFSREVLEGYENVRYFDPFDAAGLAGLMEKAIKGELFTQAAAGAVVRPGSRNSWSEVVGIITDGK